MVDYSEKAKRFQQEAQNAVKLLRRGKVDPKDVVELYEKAADSWILSTQNAGYRNKVNSLEYASSNYNLAKTFADTKYKSKLQGKIDSVNSNLSNLKKIKSGEKMNKTNIEKSLAFGIISMISLFFALIFTSFSLTGYSIFELDSISFRFIGTILFVLGLAFAFIYIKKRK